LFLSPEDNTVQNRSLLSKKLENLIIKEDGKPAGNLLVFTNSLATTGSIKPGLPIYTSEDNVIIAIEGRSFFTGQLDGKPLGGAYQGQDTLFRNLAQ
jgi:hypothetical protein